MTVGERRPRAARSAGFSLIEAMVSIVLLCTGLLAVAGLASAAVRMWRQAGDISEAAAAAREIADSVTLLGVSGGGSRTYSWGVLSWDTISRNGLVQVRFRANAGDSTGTELVSLSIVAPTD